MKNSVTKTTARWTIRLNDGDYRRGRTRNDDEVAPGGYAATSVASGRLDNE